MKALVFGVVLVIAVTAVAVLSLNVSHRVSVNENQKEHTAQSGKLHPFPPTATDGGSETLVLPLEPQ